MPNTNSPTERGCTSSCASNTQSHEASIRSCLSSSSIEEYAHKVAREAEMDIDLKPDTNESWADQVDAAKATVQTPIGAQPVQEASMPLLSDPAPSVIPYNANQPADLSLWDSNLGAVSIFGTKEFFAQDVANIIKSLDRTATYIRQRDLSCRDPNSLPQLNSFSDAAWNFVTAIYRSKWDQLLSSSNTSFRENVAAQFRQPMKGKTLGPLSVSLHNMDLPLRLVFQRFPPNLSRRPGKRPWIA